jgi:hypothetical protein
MSLSDKYLIRGGLEGRGPGHGFLSIRHVQEDFWVQMRSARTRAFAVSMRHDDERQLRGLTQDLLE